MVDIMISAPGGFMDAAASVNELPEDVLAEMCQVVLEFIQHETGTINTATLYKKCLSAGCTCSQECVQSAVNVITYIYRTVSREHTSAEELSNKLRGSSTLSEKTVSTITKFLRHKDAQSESLQQESHSVNTGRLVDLQWKLGVSTSSNMCKNLNSPFVTMTIKMAEPSGQLKTRSFEMTIAQFQNFSKQLKEMASVLETA